MVDSSHNHTEWVPFIDTATREVFELMLGCQLAASAPDLVSGHHNVTAMVGMAGKLCGVLSLQCTNNAAALMASKMLGVAIDKVGSDVADAIGEVCNMIAGNFKNKITGLTEGCMLSPPTVVIGENYTLHALADPAIEVRLLFESHLIEVFLQIHS